jgi:hypothetical protein
MKQGTWDGGWELGAGSSKLGFKGQRSEVRGRGSGMSRRNRPLNQ